MNPAININLTDLINELLINNNKEPVTINRNGIVYTQNSEKPTAKNLIEKIIASYYNYRVTGEFEEINKINELPQFNNLNINVIYDLDRLK